MNYLEVLKNNINIIELDLNRNNISREKIDEIYEILKINEKIRNNKKININLYRFKYAGKIPRYILGTLEGG
jgi:hypothetical protein